MMLHYVDDVDNIDNIEDIEDVDYIDNIEDIDDVDYVDYVDDVNVINDVKVTIVCQDSRIFDNLIPANGPVRSENKCTEKGIRVRKPNTSINPFRFTIHISLVL